MALRCAGARAGSNPYAACPLDRRSGRPNPAGTGYPPIQPPHRKSGFFCTCGSAVSIILLGILLALPATLAAEAVVGV